MVVSVGEVIVGPDPTEDVNVNVAVIGVPVRVNESGDSPTYGIVWLALGRPERPDESVYAVHPLSKHPELACV